MNAATEIAPVISAANEALRRDFPLKPFAIRHKLAGHPLLSLPRIAQLAAELPRDLIEYNSGKVAISQDPGRDSVGRSRSRRGGQAHRNRRRLDGAQARGELARLPQAAGRHAAVGRARARLQQPARRRLRAGRGLCVRVFAEFDHAVSSRQRGQFLRPYPRRKILHHFRQQRPRHRLRRRDRALDDQAPQPEIRREFCPARKRVSSVRGRRLLCAVSMAALGAHRRLLLRSRWRSPGRPARSAASTTCISSIRCCAASACRNSRRAASPRATRSSSRSIALSPRRSNRCARRWQCAACCAASRSASARIII